MTNVLEAKDLAGPTATDGNQMDSYVRVLMLPDKTVHAQTKIYKSSNSPSYKERFLFELYPREQLQKALCFQVYGTDGLSHTLIGEGDIRLGDVSLRQPVTTWVTLTDTGQVIRIFVYFTSRKFKSLECRKQNPPSTLVYVNRLAWVV